MYFGGGEEGSLSVSPSLGSPIVEEESITWTMTGEAEWLMERGRRVLLRLEDRSVTTTVPAAIADTDGELIRCDFVAVVAISSSDSSSPSAKDIESCPGEVWLSSDMIDRALL